MFLILHTELRTRICDLKEFSPHQRWTNQNLSYLCGTENQKNSLCGAGNKAAPLFNGGHSREAPQRGGSDRQERPVKWSVFKAKMQFRRQSGKGQSQSCGPHQRQDEGQKVKRKGRG